jgi:hypothetical protein
MFRNTATTEVGEIELGCDRGCNADLVPLSHLSLDLDEPATGWLAYLSGRGIEVVADDIGRSSVSRDDAKQLFDEQREAEVRKREVMARIERQAEEKDRAFRAALPRGLAWHEVPVGLTPAQAMAAGDPERDRRPRRRSLLEESLEGGTLTMHPISEPAGDQL